MRIEATLPFLRPTMLSMAVLLVATPNFAASVDESLANLILVRAKVTSMMDEEGICRGQLEITHVYSGTIKLNGRGFIASSSAISEDSNGFTLMPKLQKDEIGIWCLREYDGGLAPVRETQFNVRWPAREKFSARFTEEMALAEAIERVAKAPPDTRTALLKQLTVSEISEVSSWSIHAMAEAGNADGTTFLNQLAANLKLGLAGQVALDEVLSSLDPTEWASSTVRYDLVKNWLRGPRSQYETRMALNRIDALIQHNEIGSQPLLAALKMGVENDKLPMDSRCNAVRLFGFAAKKGLSADEAFAYLIEQVKANVSVEIRLAAAHAIKNFVPLNSERIASLHSVQEQLTDKRIADVLKEAWDRRPVDKLHQRE